MGSGAGSSVLGRWVGGSYFIRVGILFIDFLRWGYYYVDVWSI